MTTEIFGDFCKPLNPEGNASHMDQHCEKQCISNQNPMRTMQIAWVSILTEVAVASVQVVSQLGDLYAGLPLGAVRYPGVRRVHRLLGA